MSRYIPEHPEKGSVEAYAWAEKMRQARQKKARLRHQIRQAGLKVEQEFFGPGGPLAPKALQKRKLNPGAAWHEEAAYIAMKRGKQGQGAVEKSLYKGMQVAHEDSMRAAKKLGMNPKHVTTKQIEAMIELGILKGKPKEKVKKNPIAIYNPAEVAGTIYNNAIEIKAQKTGGPLKGHYKHVFGKNVRILGLKDGTVLLQHKDGKPLWITRKDYERSGRKH